MLTMIGKRLLAAIPSLIGVIIVIAVLGYIAGAPTRRATAPEPID